MPVFNKYHKGVPADAINIMRGSPWGNPYPISATHPRAEVIERFRSDLWQRIRVDPVYADAVRQLHGKNLVCCCKPAACHGDVLEAAALWLQTNMLPQELTLTF